MDAKKKQRMVKEALSALDQATHVLRSAEKVETLTYHEVATAARSASEAMAVLFRLSGNLDIAEGV